VQASDIAAQLARPQTGGPELLWSLNAGAASLHAGNQAAAIGHLDAAETIMRASDETTFNWGRIYRYGTYDGVMVHLYKTHAHLGLNDTAAARVELNRAEERQRLARQRYQRQITELEAQNERQLSETPLLRQALSAAQAAPEVRENQANLARYQSAAPFQNPAAFYLRGIYLTSRGQADRIVPDDLIHAEQAFDTASKMLDRSPRVIVEDLAAARQERVSGRRRAPQVWIIFENGQSPTLRQLNFTVPMPVLARQGGVTVRPVTVSMPGIVFNPTSYRNLEINAGGARTSTELVANFESIIAREFQEGANARLTAAVLEAVAKAVGISAANAVGGRIGGVGGALLDIGATAAANITESDTRSWLLLPREIQAARVAVPSDGRVTIRAPGGQQQIVSVPTSGSSIILVKAQTPGSPLTVQVNPL
jgi:hypothetical protein